MSDTHRRRRHVSSDSTPGPDRSSSDAERRERLLNAARKQPVDLQTLRAECHHGYIDHALRREIWPLLLGIHKHAVDNDYYPEVVEHKYLDQVRKDIIRSMFHFDVTKRYSKPKR
jgi:hypothetical protein